MLDSTKVVSDRTPREKRMEVMKENYYSDLPKTVKTPYRNIRIPIKAEKEIVGNYLLDTDYDILYINYSTQKREYYINLDFVKAIDNNKFDDLVNPNDENFHNFISHLCDIYSNTKFLIRVWTAKEIITLDPREFDSTELELTNNISLVAVVFKE